MWSNSLHQWFSTVCTAQRHLPYSTLALVDLRRRHDYYGGMSDSSLRESKREAVSRLQKAFSHLEDPNTTIAAWLTPDQEQALAEYRRVFSLRPVASSSANL